MNTNAADCLVDWFMCRQCKSTCAPADKCVWETDIQCHPASTHATEVPRSTADKGKRGPSYLCHLIIDVAADQCQFSLLSNVTFLATITASAGDESWLFPILCRTDWTTVGLVVWFVCVCVCTLSLQKASFFVCVFVCFVDWFLPQLTVSSWLDQFRCLKHPFSHNRPLESVYNVRLKLLIIFVPSLSGQSLTSLVKFKSWSFSAM